MQSLSVYRLHKLLVVVGLLHVRVNAQTSTADRTTETGEAAITGALKPLSVPGYIPLFALSHSRTLLKPETLIYIVYFIMQTRTRNARLIVILLS